MTTTTAPRFSFRVFPLALPEPMESQLAREGFAPWMLTTNSQQHADACRALGHLAAFEALDNALRDLSVTKGIGAVLFKTIVSEIHQYLDGRTWTHEQRQLTMLENRRDYLAQKIARDLIEQRHTAAEKRRWARTFQSRVTTRARTGALTPA
jgi:hypothetical protein